VAATVITAAAAFLAPASADAAISGVFGGQTVSGQAITCTVQTDGTRVCHGDYSSSGGADTRLKSFDGTPLALYVTLPPAPASGTDGRYPLVVQSHGWDSPTTGPGDTQYFGPTADAWAKDGYAVLQLVARGFGDSCGTAAARLTAPSACANGYLRLDDVRYEARDVQYAIGLLVDEGVVDPGRLGVTGESYGGGVSLELASLRNRIMNPDGTLSPWTSPAGTPLSVTAAAPVIPWSDLVYSLVPNGRTLDYALTSPTADLSPIGIEKQSYVTGLEAEGNQTGYYAPPGTNSQADLTSWFASLNAGEPYDSNATDVALVQQIAQYHSPYYLLDGAYGAAKVAPPPLLIANGFTDDLFPVDEGLRYYDLERSLYPADPVGLFDWDGGHARGQNKAADNALLSARIQTFFDHYLKGAGAPPTLGATALTQTCPKTAPSGGPYWAATWAGLHPGEVAYTSPAAQTVSSGAGNPQTAQAVDPITGSGACATAAATDQGAGVATYRLPAATGSGYTLLGSPTVIANLHVTGSYPLIAARLWDVDPATNTETLVARGLYRISTAAPNGRQAFQLHPGAWHFAAGHVPKLELLGQDPPYARTSNGQFSIGVSGLQLRLPVHEVPGVRGTPPAVTKPLPAFHQPGTRGSAPCTAGPTSRIDKRRARLGRRRLSVSGTAAERTCLGASAATRRRQRVAHVYLSVSRMLGHGRCRFLTAGGRLSRPRSCRRLIELPAAGTGHWRFHRRLSIPPGLYVIGADAVDAQHHHQRRSGASVMSVRVR
jgi:poly(3-hydroxybutyrate) depolymerase